MDDNIRIESQDRLIKSLVEITAEDYPAARRLLVDYTLQQHDTILANFTSRPCENSKATLAQQLCLDKVVVGETWSTHHIAHEFQCAEILNMVPLDILSPLVDLFEGVQVQLRLADCLTARNFACRVNLFGFRGKMESTVTAFRFERGAPRQKRLTIRCIHDGLQVLSLLLKQERLVDEGWLTPDKKIRVLLTLHLRVDAEVMALVQPTIEAFPHITAQWSSPPCAYSRVVLSEQLREEKVVEGEEWSTHHMAHEFCSTDFADGDATFEIVSPMVDLCEGVQDRLHVERAASGGSVEAYVQIFGFRGEVELTATAFRFGRGAPKQHSSTLTWCELLAEESENFWTCGIDLKQTQLAVEGWLTPDNKIRYLLTLHLSTDAEVMALVQPIIEAHPHITAQWSSPPCAYSRVVLSEQLQECTLFDTQHISHEFCSLDFADGDACFEIDSPMVCLFEGVQGCLKVRRSAAGCGLGCLLHLRGFRGKAECTMTAFRFDKGAPKEKMLQRQWTEDGEEGWPSLFTQAQLVSEGWLTAEGKIRLLFKLTKWSKEFCRAGGFDYNGSW